MKKNKGFSLIELVVVMAILAIVTSGVVYMVMNASTWKAKKAVQYLDESLSQTRVEALSKSRAWLALTYEGDHYVLKRSYDEDLRLDGKFSITYTYGDSSSADPKNQALVLTYDRTSGGFSDMKKQIPSSGGDYESLASPGVYCKSITITQGSKSWTINLNKETGKHSVVKG